MKSNKPINSIKVILIEDLGLLRKTLKEILETQYPFIQVVATASDGLTGVEIAQALDPDVIVTNIGLPVINGIEATARITKANPEAKVVIFTVHRVEGIKESIEAGAKAYLMKDTCIEGLVILLRYVKEGGRWVDSALKEYGSYPDDVYLQEKHQAQQLSAKLPTIDKRIVAASGNIEDCGSTADTNRFISENSAHLSEAETIITRLILCGRNFKDIADLLQIEEAKIKPLVYNILNKIRQAPPPKSGAATE